MASGDVVNTAARLQSAAPVNGVLVDETTYRATRSMVDYEEAPPVDAKGKARADHGLAGVSGAGAAGRRRRARVSFGARRPRAASSEFCATHSNARARANVTARDTRRSARHRQEPPRLRASPDRRCRPRPHHLAPGPLPRLRGRRHAVGTRRDRQGAGRDPRAGSADGGGRESPCDRRGAAHRLGRRIVGRVESALTRRARIREPARRRSPRRGVLRVAPLLRGDGRAPSARPRLRGSPLGGREPPRLRRRARRVGDGRAAARGRDGAARAPRTPTRLGRRQAERDDARRLRRCRTSRLRS